MSEVLRTGLYLTVAGMGLVFMVLAMLWALIVLLIKFDKESQPSLQSEVMGIADSASNGVVRSEIAAAIAVAIHAYENDKKRLRVMDTSFGVARDEVDPWSLAGRAQQHKDWQPRRWK